MTMTAATPAPRKPSRAALRIVASKTGEPDLAALDRVLTETAQQLAPMVSRTGSVRARMIAEMKVLEADREALHARRRLVESHYKAISTAFDSEERDIDAAISAYRAGLGEQGEGPTQ
jgi:hypothetical protein